MAAKKKPRSREPKRVKGEPREHRALDAQALREEIRRRREQAHGA